jgi:hypothetical protein
MRYVSPVSSTLLPFNAMNSKLLIPALLSAMALTSHAAVILSTDFSGRTVSGTTASNITWTTDGVSDPGSSLTVDNVVLETHNGNLFNTANAAGHFAPANNVGNGGIWETSFTINVTGAPIQLSDIELGWNNFTGAGAFQNTLRSVQYTVTVLGNTSATTVSGSFISDLVLGVAGGYTNSIALPITIDSSESWTFTIRAEEGIEDFGNNTGLNSITLNAIPEPTITLLGCLGLLALLRRQR